MDNNNNEIDEILANADEGWYGYKALHGAKEETEQRMKDSSNTSKEVYELDGETLAQIIALKKTNSKIGARKLYLDATGAGLIESVKAVDEIWENN